MLDSDSEAEDYLMTDTGIENAENFKAVWNGDVKAFLKREEYIAVRGTAISKEESHFLVLRPDVDGISIRWKDIGKGMKSSYTHLNLAPRSDYEIKPIYSIVKKHMNLAEYGKRGISNLKASVGYQVIYSEGWETWLSFLPQSNRNNTEYTMKVVRDMTAATLKSFRLEFQKQLKELLMRGEATDTLSKNNLENLLRMFVLPGDRDIVLSVFQRCLEETEVYLPGFKAMLITFRFGEKCNSPVQLPILDKSGVEDICAHIGLSISSNTNDLFWCRDGVNQVIGRRGQVVSVLSFFECVNFQSNLDERRIDVSSDLLEVCRYPANVRFVQMYSDIPHRRPGTVVHPVSASVIVADGIFRDRSKRKVYEEAVQYIGEIRNNFNQIRDGNCRLEFVVCLPEVESVVDGRDFILERNVLHLLETHAMLAPFDHSENVMGCVKNVGLYLCERLMDLYATRRGTGDSECTWEAYQYECAVERLLWGSPFCSQSGTYSVNLGIGLSYPTRSLTDQKGFLCLEESSSCCADENSTPPLTIYTSNVIVQKQVTRMFGLYNFINSSQLVAGRRIILCLLEDIYVTGNVFIRFPEFLLSMKKSSGNENKKIVGGINLKALAGKIAGCKKFKWPMVFGSVTKLFSDDNERLTRLCLEGFHALELGFFPAIRFSDANRSEGLNWRYTYGVWVLMDDDMRRTSFGTEAESLHSLVLIELERWKICHTSPYQRMVFPWLKSVLEKISEKHLKQEEKLLVLAFVSCVALLMNGRYVDYYNLSRLERKIPITQVMLRMLEVLCKFRLGNVNTLPLWRLHPSIPYKLDSKGNKRLKVESVDVNHQKECTRELIRDENEISGMETINDESGTTTEFNIVRSRHIPTNACCGKTVWSAGEIELLKSVTEECQGSTLQRYTLYQKQCLEKGIPDRSLRSFACKLSRQNKK